MSSNRANMDNGAFDGVITEMALRQLGGAEIKKMRGLQYQIDFPLKDGYKVRYVYTINTNNALFLQRLLPYPMRPEKFDTESNLIKFIKIDFEKFKNAQNSNNFKSFIVAMSKIHDITAEFEDAFLNYNLASENIGKFSNALNEINQNVSEIKAIADKIELDFEALDEENKD